MHYTQSTSRGFLKASSEKAKTEIKHIFFTSYNPVYAQTDGDPCKGASGKDQCKLSEKGERTIALSRDLVGRGTQKLFTYGDKVMLKGEIDDPRCNGEFTLLDTMAARFRHRGDIFVMKRKDNIGCWATVTKI